jgi:hypothetical protein
MVFSAWVLVVVLVILAGLCINIRAGGRRISDDGYRRFRDIVMLFAIVYAGITVLHVLALVPLTRPIDPSVRPHLIGYSIFWVIVPPLWFFFEYFAHESDWVEDGSKKLDKIKAYADLSTKIWAGVLALLGVLIAFG